MVQFRPLISDDQEQLWHWLHLALWDPPPAELRPKEVLDKPLVRVYAENWGRSSDIGVVAVVDGKDIGACWMRILPPRIGLAYVDAKTPQLGIALLPEFQRRGYGTKLMNSALEAASFAGFQRVSLTVHPENPAIKLYSRCGFQQHGLRDSYHLMVWTDSKRTGN